MALIPPEFMDCVVAIGVKTTKGCEWVASGFLYGRPLEKSDEERVYGVYLVTNRHVVAEEKHLVLRFNPEGTDPAKQYDIDFDNASYPPGNADVAIVPIDVQRLRQDGIRFNYFRSNLDVADREAMRTGGVTEGDGVFVLGFPMRLVGKGRSAVLVRSGSIARVSDTLSGASSDFILDAMIFPGNSGGPVILKPDLTTITGTRRQQNALLIGVVSASIQYLDEAISRQTGKTRVVFEDNTGLSKAWPIDFVNQAIEEAFKSAAESKAPESASEADAGKTPLP